MIRTREELESELDVLIVETTTIPKKDRDRLVDILADFIVEDLYVELEEEEEEAEEDE